MVPPSDKSEKRLLQIGGLSGILSNVVFIISFVAFGDTLPTAGQMGQFLSLVSANNSHLILFSAGWFAGSLLLLMFYLALYSNLKKSSPGYATIGGALGVISGAAFAAFPILSASAFSGLAGLYGSAATAANKAVFATAAEGANAILNGVLGVEGYIRVIAIFALGTAMLGSTSFGKRYGWVTIIFGAAFVAVFIAAVYAPVFYIVDGFVYLAWSIVAGQKLLRLSRRLSP